MASTSGWATAANQESVQRGWPGISENDKISIVANDSGTVALTASFTTAIGARSECAPIDYGFFGLVPNLVASNPVALGISLENAH